MQLGLSGLLAIAPSGTCDYLLHYSEAQARAKGLLSIIKELEEIQQLSLLGIQQSGDRFRALRLLKRIPNSELIRLIVELGMPDAESMLPCRMELKVRR